MAGVALLPPVIASFVRQRPNVRVQLFTRNSDLVRGMFPSRTIDIGIAELPIDPTGLNVIRYRLECVAVLPEDHALCAHEIITPKLMSGLPFVGMSREWAAHHLVNSVFAEAAAHLNVVVASELFAMICELVANGVGVSIVDPSVCAAVPGGWPCDSSVSPARPLRHRDLSFGGAGFVADRPHLPRGVRCPSAGPYRASHGE